MMFLTCAVLLAVAAGADERFEDLLVCPRLPSAPAIDGSLSDASWKAAREITDFTRPLSAETPRKAIRALVGFDDRFLYIAFDCTEPSPERLRVPRGEPVWRGDCVEVWVRGGGGALECLQFVLGPRGAREGYARGRRRDLQGWLSGTKVHADRWTAELALPWELMDFGPERGELFELKLGREDRAGRPVGLSTWPGGSPYAGGEGLRAVYLDAPNLLPDPLLETKKGWGFSKGDSGLFVHERGELVFRSPGRYVTAQRGLRLWPGRAYRLEALVQSDCRAYLRARVGRKSTPHTARVDPSQAYRLCRTSFFTDPDGRVLFILGSPAETKPGTVRIRALRLVREARRDASGPRVRVEPGRPVRVEKLAVSDCRALRGFVLAPVDGTENSLGWNAGKWEYGKGGAGAGVGYSYRGNNGLHITLASDDGFDSILVRGGVKARVYADCPRFDDPEGGRLLAELPGRARSTRFTFPERVRARKVSFFDVSDGLLADVSFLRTGPARGGRPTWCSPLEKTALPDKLAFRFQENDRTAYELVPSLVRDFELPAKKWVHLAFPASDGEETLDSVAVEVEAPYELPLTVRVQDPVDPLREAMGADLLFAQGRGRAELDFPDMVLPSGRRLWVSLKAEFGARLRVRLAKLSSERKRAAAEDAQWRLLHLKGLFCAMSEARPWNGWYTDERIKESLAGKYGPQLQAIVDVVDHLRSIAPDDETVRQYYEWIWRRHRPWRAEHNRGIYLGPEHAKVTVPEGAPEWAAVARAAWIEARKVPEWWLDERLVPTGEFGGVVGDDSDMYQNYADFVMFEDGGLAGRLKEAAAALSELAERQNLLHGLNKRSMDPLHAYEEGVNHEALMAWWFYGDPVYFNRCLVAARSLRALTKVTPKGHRHFKSQMCGAMDLTFDRPTDQDGHAHPLMLHPAFEVAWYSRHPKVMEFLREWGDGWTAHMEPDNYATAVEVATEKVVATTRRPLYGGYGALGSAFLFMYDLTRDAKFLSPFMDRFRKSRADTSPGRIVPELYHAGALDDVAAGLVSAEPVLAALVKDDLRPLIDALKADVAEMQNYRHMYTSAEVFTDRVFLRAVTNAAIVYTGGFATRNKFNHTHAVSWEGLGTDYAALVKEARADRLRVGLYGFADRKLTGRMRVWRLRRGVYRFRFGPDADGDFVPDAASRDETVELYRARAVEFTLPPRESCALTVELVRELPDLTASADLALSPLDLVVERGRVRGMVHNIGCMRVAEVELALVDPRGRERKRLKLGPLDAPLDLEPKKLPFKLRAREGWKLVVDPDGVVEEIHEGNNELIVPRAQ